MYKFLLAAAALQILLPVIDCWMLGRLSKRETIIDTGTDIEICTQAPIDLGIVLDASSSITRKDFKTAVRFLRDYLDRFDIGSGKEGVRVSVITYGRGIYPQDGFNLTTYNTKEEVLEAVSRIPHREGDYTDTGKAIKYMSDVQLAPSVVRSWAEKISIVITDGDSQEPKVTKKAAEDARKAGIRMFALGVGSGVKDEELKNIAGDESRVTRVDNYGQLDSIKKILASKTCIKKPKPTTSPPPKIEKCGEVNPSDIYFAFSPAKLGVDATGWTTAFIANTISAEDLGVGFRYGVVSGSCPDDEGFDLDTYRTLEEYKARLEQYDHNPLPHVIERLLGDAYSVKRGGRVKARKVAVIVASGDSRENEELSAYVERLLDNRVKVFIADPNGSGLSIDGAVSLSGRSSRSQAEDLINALCPENGGFD